MLKYRIAFIGLLMACFLHLSAQQTVIKYLSGTDKDHTVKWDFYCTAGMKSGSWTTIAVPSQWELQGFGGYNYGNDKRAKKIINTEEGWYKTHFTADKTWGDKEIELVFEGVMTDTEVKVNGQLAGAIHQGSFYRFSYPISKLIKPGADNLLEVKVSKVSADPTVNQAEREGDFWIFGGIYRPVYLKIMPQTHIQHVAINALANGSFEMDVQAEGLQAGDEIGAQIQTLDGKNAGKSFSTSVKDATSKIRLSQTLANPMLWNPELPKLYNVAVTINRQGRPLHTLQQRFGFRTIEVKKGEGIFVNGEKIMMKGVDRHSFWPESGRTLSRAVHLMDIKLMKEMNMNAVRMSHYPPDAEFLDLCDSLGLFVLDELTGWHQKYGSAVGHKLVKEMVARDVNHPSILFWDNGNEGGWNTELDKDFALYDPQQRTVLHPWNKFSDIDTKHYPDYNYIKDAAAKGDILLHTEMIHGLYDGGHGAGLEDYWNLMRANPRHAGGFLWVLGDEGVVRRDKRDSIDTNGNEAPDGIVGPHREKEASFYTIKELWSPVQITNPDFGTFSGKLQIQNQYIYTNLSACQFSWELVKYAGSRSLLAGHKVIAAGKTLLGLPPGKTADLDLHLPANWRQADALRFKAVDRFGRELYMWTWPISTPAVIANRELTGSKGMAPAISEVNAADQYTIVMGTTKYVFDPANGLLLKVVKKGQELVFGNGPSLAGVTQMLQSFSHKKVNAKTYTVEAAYTGDATMQVKWTFTLNKPVKLEYTYTQTAPADFYGITFNIDEAKITGMKWLGGGPYRVWKNRLKGAEVDVWHKKYNNTITGETNDYPEFKGYHANLYWATIEAGTSTFTVYTNKPGVYLQVLRPQQQKTKFNPFVNPTFPEGNMGFLIAIAPIGTKFKAANSMGPQSQLNQPSATPVSGQLWFDFR